MGFDPISYALAKRNLIRLVEVSDSVSSLTSGLREEILGFDHVNLLTSTGGSGWVSFGNLGPNGTALTTPISVLTLATGTTASSFAMAWRGINATMSSLSLTAKISPTVSDGAVYFVVGEDPANPTTIGYVGLKITYDSTNSQYVAEAVSYDCSTGTETSTTLATSTTAFDTVELEVNVDFNAKTATVSALGSSSSFNLTCTDYDKMAYSPFRVRVSNSANNNGVMVYNVSWSGVP